VTGVVDSAVSSAVLLREASRTSRRWQTYLARTAFSAVLMGLVLAGIWVTVEAPFVDKSQLGWMGFAMFTAFTVVQMMLACVLAPMMVARAVIEERQDGTLDLLVLTPIKAGPLLSAKVLSRLLVLLTLVLGALPLLSLVVTLGGVGVSEVINVTASTVVAVGMLGLLGGYFALFTRSPMVATVAALGWGMVAFLIAPIGHALLLGTPYAVGQVSPLMSAAGRNFWGLLILPTYLPLAGLVLVYSTKMFRLRMANAELRRYFSDDVWKTRFYMVAGLVFLLLSFVWIPVALTGAYYASGKLGLDYNPSMVSPVDIVIGGAGRGIGWLWTVSALYLTTWFYLRLGMDLVDALDGFLSTLGRGRRRSKLMVWKNPVLWRESRISAWGAGGLPLLVGWLLVLFGIFQTGWWIIPGGLLSLGGLNAAGALLLTVWLGIGSVVTERETGTLQLLLISKIPSWRVISGKLGALSLPTMPMLFLSMPMIVLGVPHIYVFMDNSGDHMVNAVANGIGICLWLLPFWVVSAEIALLVGLRVRRTASAYGLALGIVVGQQALPAFIAWVFDSWGLLVLPFRLVAPALVGDAVWWEFLISGSVYSVIAVGLFVLLTVRVRVWGGSADA
jgi:ABC-type transport system involved in multi-copper enzyme maturation permease subunit